MSAPITTLLREFTVLINTFGPNSCEAKAYMDRHRDNEEFVELGELAVRVKLALTSPSLSDGCEYENGCPR